MVFVALTVDNSLEFAPFATVTVKIVTHDRLMCRLALVSSPLLGTEPLANGEFVAEVHCELAIRRLAAISARESRWVELLSR